MTALQNAHVLAYFANKAREARHIQGFGRSTAKGVMEAQALAVCFAQQEATERVRAWRYDAPVNDYFRADWQS